MNGMVNPPAQTPLVFMKSPRTPTPVRIAWPGGPSGQAGIWQNKSMIVAGKQNMKMQLVCAFSQRINRYIFPHAKGTPK